MRRRGLFSIAKMLCLKAHTRAAALSSPLDRRTNHAINQALQTAGISRETSYHFHWPPGYNADPRHEVWQVPGRALLSCLARIGDKDI